MKIKSFQFINDEGFFKSKRFNNVTLCINNIPYKLMEDQTDSIPAFNIEEIIDEVNQNKLHNGFKLKEYSIIIDKVEKLRCRIKIKTSVSFSEYMPSINVTEVVWLYKPKMTQKRYCEFLEFIKDKV